MDLQKRDPNRVECLNGDANQELKSILSRSPWTDQKAGRGPCRALCFLDPYGMGVNWSTLYLLAETRAVDVWYLFPIEAVGRQLAGDFDKIDIHKKNKLNEIFGTDSWESEIYKEEKSTDLFAEQVITKTRQFDRQQIEHYAIKRLRSLFCEVSDPLPLLSDTGHQKFSLFCLSNSNSKPAIAAIKRGHEWVIKRHAQGASRRK